MGIDTEFARFLLECRRDGASFERTLTFGRQTYFPSNKETAALLREFGLEPSDYPKAFEDNMKERYSDGFFQALGCNRLDSMDASTFEGATVIHDLNTPIGRDLKNQFDAVVDGGTMEHVFNFPTALLSALAMVKPGGHFFSCNPTNNFFGHGFYQLEPQCYWKALLENGFTVKRMISVEYGPFRRWHSLDDPRNYRVNPVSHFPVNLMVCGRKILL